MGGSGGGSLGDGGFQTRSTPRFWWGIRKKRAQAIISPIGFDQLPPVPLRLEEIRKARAGRAGGGQRALPLHQDHP